MSSRFVFGHVDSQTRWLRITLLAATLIGMLCCFPLWLSSREYPRVPILEPFAAFPPIAEWVVLIGAFGSLVAALRYYRVSVVFFLSATLLLYAADENRGQPWMHLYWTMLLLTLLPERTAVAACRVALCVVYVWAGVQKLNAKYFEVIPAWFARPAMDWGWPSAVVQGIEFCVAAAPIVEISIGLGVWFLRTRKGVIIAAMILHVVSLLFLGPLGHAVNLVVWPWNLAMMGLVLVLFGTGDFMSLGEAWLALRRSGFALAVLALFALLPVLSFFGLWDSYLSFALYSANVSRADFYVTAEFRDALPPRMRRFVEPVANCDPRFQLPFTFAHAKWGVAEMGAPPMPEPRGFAVMFRDVVRRAGGAKGCHMIVERRGGGILLFRPGEASAKLISR